MQQSPSQTAQARRTRQAEKRRRAGRGGEVGGGRGIDIQDSHAFKTDRH